MNKYTTLFLIAILRPLVGQAQENPTSETQKLLKTPEAREKALKEMKSPKADEANKLVQKIGASKGQTEEIYSLSSDIFGDLVKKAGEDPEKMQKILDEAARNPANFAAQLTPEQLKKLKEIVEKLQAPPANP